MLERSLSRVLIGIVMIGNGVSVLLHGRRRPRGARPDRAKGGDPTGMSDPLPQAMVLTAIVITLGTTAFLLAMAYRSWQLNGHDDVQDDVEDADHPQARPADATSEAYSATTSDYPGDDSSGDHGQGPDDDPLAADARR